MGERIDFPRNYELYLKKAVHTFQEGNVVEACQFFKEAYAIHQEPSVNAMYVSALYQLEDYEQAKEIADDKKKLYENDESLYNLYTTILIKNHLFIEAERIIQKKMAQQSLTASTKEMWNATSHALEYEKNKQKQEKKKYNQELLKEILAMGDKSFEHQAALVKDMKELDKEWYALGARSILRNPFVNEIVKSTVLEILIGHQTDEEFELYWFSQRRFITPTKLTSLEDEKVVKYIIKVLKEQFEDENPSLYHALLQEMNLYFLLLHPYIEEVITDADEWLSISFKRYDTLFSHKMENDKKSQKMEIWMNRLNTEIENMMT
ncbi:hydrolase [Desemzia sp. RIT804]|uniref:tetratricopeptide repeat protein n=1 Tax=Desemzia sp. RIT 804 TaxID=2810209 RepID=UPI0019509322|nr:hydrolase [Desemzia sp. RIT 804]MBM6613936.1 hydrolase [Desemzia sp. RIT 804]